MILTYSHFSKHTEYQNCLCINLELAIGNKLFKAKMTFMLFGTNIF